MTRRGVAALAVALLLVAGCGDDSDDGDAADDSTTTTTDATTDGGAVTGVDEGDDAVVPSPYDGYETEVYDDDARWICRPDLADDECRDLDVTVVAADGSRTVEEREPAADPPVDCFYVYPTVSADPGAVSDLEWTPEDAEAATVRAQAAQYARSCRVFAPVYRQVTLSGLGTASQDDRAAAYADVVDAWKTYVSRWNEGRGVILIGHSQGTGHLVRLLQDEVDGNDDVQRLLVAAHLFGGTVQAPEGEVVGGDFESVPACTSADETGCVVFWSTYPAEAPPVPEAIFSRSDDEGRSLCVDATELLGEERAHPVVPVDAPLVGGIPGTDDVETPFLSLPDALEVECASTADHDYLAVGLVDPDDARPVDGLLTETLGPTWGLHLVDVNVALDDLVALAARQAEAYATS